MPLAQKAKKHWHPSEDKQQPQPAVTAASGRVASGGGYSNQRGGGDQRGDVAAEQALADLSRMSGTEEDKIQAMILQSSLDYDPSK